MAMDEQPPLRQLTADPGFLLSRVGAAVRAGFKDVLAHWGVRPQQYLVLLILDGADGVSQQELCTAARVDSGNMVELLDGLEAHAYAQRSRDPRDRRRYLVTITPAGRTALSELRQAVAHYDQRFFSRLTPAEQDQLVTTLAKLYDGPTQPHP
jgi:MarR family transcriptional regulator, lower aerobic nicotinate degradation pathway regulator